MLSRLFRKAKRASGGEVGAPRRGFRFFGCDLHRQLEARQLLSGMVTETVSYSASIPEQVTDYTLPLSLPKFDPALGTLESVGLTLDVGGTVSGTVTNNGENPETLTVAEAITIDLLDGSTTLLSPVLNASQSFTNLAGGGVGPFNPPPPSQSASATYTGGGVFNDFAGGPGNLGLDVETNTVQTTTGGGGNISSDLNTTAGATATVTYTYSVATVSVSGNVYDDVNGTGTLQPGDLPIPGTTLTLLDSTGAVVATTQTAADGTYSFTTTSAGGPLFANTYEVVETQPAGYLQGTNTVGTVNGATDGTLTSVQDVIAAIKLAPGQDSINNNFGEVLPVGLSGTVYNDVNGTGSLATNDPPIPGTRVDLYDAAGLVATTTTDAFGNYAFLTSTSGAPLPPATYTLVETQPAGYLQGTNTVGTVNGVTVGGLPSTDVIGSIALHSGQDSVHNNFGEVLPVGLSGTVYVDVNHTGSLATNDPPIPGTRVDLYDAAGLVATTTTDAFGNYAFLTSTSGAPLPPATYTLVETQPAGYLQGTNTVGTVNGVTVGGLPSTDVIGSIALHSGQDSVHNNFGEILPTPPPPPPPVNFHVTNIQRFGVHLQPTLIVISFDQPLNPATAQDVGLYQIFGPTDSKHPTVIPIESASYNPATGMVTLRLGQRLNVHHPYRLTINGLEDASGGLLVGSNGVPGGPYVATLNRSQLSGFTDIYGNFIPINHGQLYPAAIASGYHLKRFVRPTNLGSFAAANTATFLAATANDPEPAPITLHKGKKLHLSSAHGH